MYHYDVLDDIYSILQTDKSIFIKFAAKRWRRVQKLLQKRKQFFIKFSKRKFLEVEDRFTMETNCAKINYSVNHVL